MKYLRKIDDINLIDDFSSFEDNSIILDDKTNEIFIGKPIGTFTIDCRIIDEGIISFNYEKGMTWDEFVLSSYNNDYLKKSQCNNEKYIAPKHRTGKMIIGVTPEDYIKETEYDLSSNACVGTDPT